MLVSSELSGDAIGGLESATVATCPVERDVFVFSLDGWQLISIDRSKVNIKRAILVPALPEQLAS